MTLTLEKLKKAVRKAPKIESAVDSRAMLVCLNISFWEGRRKDSAKTNEITSNNKADKDAGAWHTRLVPREALQPLMLARNRGYLYHMSVTMPWMDNGSRILSSKLYFDYMAEMNKHKTEFEKQVHLFVKSYPTHVAKAQKRLGDLWRPEFFPNASEIADKFAWSVKLLPIPTAGDFRVDLGQDQVDEIRQSIELNMQEAMATAMGDLWERLHAAVSHIVEKLKNPESIFRDSLISNASELCELLRSMNIVNDPNLERMRMEVQDKLVGKNPEALRKNSAVRADAAKQASDILNRINQLRSK